MIDPKHQNPLEQMEASNMIRKQPYIEEVEANTVSMDMTDELLDE